MIKELFLPTTIGNYYLFRKKIATIDINKTTINACLVSLSGASRTIEQVIEVPIEPGSPGTLQERTRAALVSIKETLYSYDELVTIIPGYLAITKELKVPLDDRDKISLVISFEMEPLLPFARQDTIIDFVITKKVPAEHSTELIAAAIQKNHINDHLLLCESAGLKPTKITLDTFILYAIYKQIPSYQSYEGSSIIIDISSNHTQVAYLVNNQLRSVRSLNHGVSFIAKTVGTILHQNSNQAMEHLLRYGLEPNDNTHDITAVKKALDTFWQEIAFTLDIFTHKSNQSAITHILITGLGTQIKGIIPYVTSISGIQCQEFNIKEFMEHAQVDASLGQKITDASLVCLGAALPIPDDYNANLLHNNEQDISRNLLWYVGTAITITLVSLMLLIGVTQWRLNVLNNEIYNSEQEAVQELREQFVDLSDSDDTLEEAIGSAQSIIAREEATWFAFSNPSRISFLEYLLELTNAIDKIATGFEPTRIAINEKMITIQASVKNHDALQTFEHDLKRSKLLKQFDEQANYANFTIKIMLNNPIGEE